MLLNLGNASWLSLGNASWCTTIYNKHYIIQTMTNICKITKNHIVFILEIFFTNEKFVVFTELKINWNVVI